MASTASTRPGRGAGRGAICAVTLPIYRAVGALHGWETTEQAKRPAIRRSAHLRRLEPTTCPQEILSWLSTRASMMRGATDEIGSSDGQDADDPSPQTGESLGTPSWPGLSQFVAG